MGGGGLILEQMPGWVPQPDSFLAAGQGLNGLLLSRIQMLADFAATNLEVFYQEVEDGGTLELPQSTVTRRRYSAAECLNYWEYRSTVRDITGIPLANGGLLILNNWVDPYALSVSMNIDYYVQGGAESPTNDGRLSVWTFGSPGRGNLAGPGYTPAYSYLADSAFASSPALTQTLLENLNDNAMAGATRAEVFTDCGTGTAWQAGYTVAGGYQVKPTIYHANGCYYTALVGGTTGDTEPPWPTQLASLFWDGSVLWNCSGRGFTNGQTFALPTSWDGYAYQSGDFVGALCSWITTGQPNGTGPTGTPGSPGAARIQRLQKSVDSSRLVSSTVTYYDGNNTAATNDGVLNVVAFFQRSVSAQPSTPPAYNVMEGNEFMSGQTVTIALLEDLNENINNAIARPSFFLDTGVASGGAPTLPTDAVTGYAYERSETMNVWGLDDTGDVSGNYALRLFQTTVDPNSGLVTLRVDYNEPAQHTTDNGVLDVVTLAARQASVLLDGMAILNLNGSPSVTPPGGGNIIPNGDFGVWNNLLKPMTQVVAVPASWTISNNSADGYTTQQPGIPQAGGPYSVGLDVGNSHAPSYNQYVSLLSYPVGVVASGLYSYNVWVYANPAISTGFILRIHFRDINFANDVYFDLVPDQALGTSPTNFSGRFTIPSTGDTAVPTTGGALTLSAAAPSELTYVYAEIWNYEPNISSTVIVGIVDIENQSGLSDAVAPTAGTGTYEGTVNPLSQSGMTTTILVAANDWLFPTPAGSQPVAYNAGSVDPGSFGTWLVYCLDPNLLGGAVTYLATQNPSDLAAQPGIVPIGAITTSPTGTPSGVDSGLGFSTSNPVSTAAFANSLIDPELVVVGVINMNGTTISTPTDTAGNTYLDCGAGLVLFNGGALSLQLFYALNTATTINNVVSVANSAGNLLGVFAQVFLAMATSSPVDVYGSVAAGTISSGSPGNVPGPSITTTSSKDVVVGLAGVVATVFGSMSPGPGFSDSTVEFLSPVNGEGSFVYSNQAIGGPITTAWSAPCSAGAYAVILAAFKPVNQTSGIGIGLVRRAPVPANAWNWL